MANPSATEINRLDIAVEVNATRANRALLLMANRLDEIAKSLDRLMSRTSGIAAVGEAAEKSVKAMTSVETTAKKAGNETKKTAEKTAEVGKAAETAAVKVDKMTDALEKAVEASEKFKTANNVTRSDMESRYRDGWKRASTAMGGGNKAESAQAAAIAQDPTRAVTADSVTRDTMIARYAAGWKSASSALASRTSNSTEKYLQDIARINAENQRSVQIFSAVTSAAGKFAGKLAMVAIRMEMLPFKALTKIPGLFRSATSAVVKFGKALAHPIAALKELLGLNKKTGGGILGGLLGNKSLAKYVGLIALRRAVTGAIRAIVKGIQEGFQNIRQYSSAINSEMYTIQNSLLYVKNAWAAAFAPIISVVKPYVNALLDIIASALNAIGRLVAILTGKGFTVQAVKFSDALYEAGQAGDAAASGAKNASKAAEEYKKTIMGFDQLNVLNAPNDGSGSGGSGGGGGGGSNNGLNVQDMFEEVDLTGRLKDAIDAGNWEEVGAYFAEHINAFFTKVDEAVKWENVGDKITSVIDALTRTVNSLVDNVDWDLVGTTAAHGLETIVNSYNLLFDGLNFENLGSKFSEAVNGFVSNVPWESVGAALVQKFNAIWETGGSFISGLNYTKIANAIGTALTGGIKKIKLEDVGSTLANLINNVSMTISLVNMTFDVDTLRKKLAGFINNAIGGINADSIKSTMVGLASTIGDLLGTSLKSFFQSGGTSKISTILSGAVESVTVFLKSFNMEMDWDAAKEDIKNAIIKLFGYLSKSDFLDSAFTVGLNIVQAIADAISDPATTEALNEFGNKLGESLATLPWMEILANLAGAILQALVALLEGALTGLRRGILKKFGLSDEQIATYEEGTSDLKDNFAAIENGDYSSLLSEDQSYDRGKADASSYTSGYVDGIGDGKPKAEKAAGEFSDAAYNGMGNQGEKGTTKGQALGTGYTYGMTLEERRAAKEAEKLTKGAYDGMGVQGDKGKTKGQALGTGYTYGMTLEERRAAKEAGILSKAAYDGMGNQGDKGRTKGSALSSSYASGIDSNQNAAANAAGRVAQGAVDKFNAVMKNASYYAIDMDVSYSNFNGKNYPTKLTPNLKRTVVSAEGGIFDMPGQLFIAREAGPELVGSMGRNKNVVANNQQIIEGIEAGVARGMAAALSVTNSGGNTMPYEINVTVKTQNDEVLARCVERGQAKRKYRLGMAMG